MTTVPLWYRGERTPLQSQALAVLSWSCLLRSFLSMVRNTEAERRYRRDHDLATGPDSDARRSNHPQNDN
jgi:hypothetical protein